MIVADRRSFLKRLAAFMAVLASGGLGARSAPARSAGKSPSPEEKWFGIGRLGDFAEGSPAVVRKAHEVGGMQAISDPKLIGIRRGDQVHVMSLKCTHHGCKVELRKDGSYRCPCHAATFDAAGGALKGPASTPLPWYETRATAAGEVEVNMSHTVPAPP